MSDALLYELSSSQGALPEPFIKRDIAWVGDSMNGSYQSTSLTLDLSAVANAGKWQSWSEAVLQIPLVLTVRAPTAGAMANLTANVGPQNLVALKSNFAHLIHSVTAKINNTEVISACDFQSVPMTFRMLTQFGQDDLVKLGPSIGFSKDGTSFNYDNATTTITNNDPATNEGLAKRVSETTGLVYPSDATDGSADILTDATYSSTVGQPGWAPHVAGQTYQVGYVIAEIRLADLHPLFRELPLTKGGYLWMNLVVNQTQIDFSIATKVIDPTTIVVNTPSNGVCPLMLLDYVTPSGSVDNGVYSVSVGIVQCFDTVARGLGCPSHPAFNQVRCYLPLYIMDASKVQAYEALGAEREVSYSDFSRPGVPSQSAGSSFNLILSSGINRLKSVLVAPYFTNGLGTTVAYQSPLTTEPSTCSPLARISNYNVALSGTNVYQEDENYSFEFFQNEIVGLGVNGQLTPGMTSGVVSKADWERMYGFLYTDCSRRLGPAYESATSVTIKGTVKTKVALTPLTFLEYERRIVMDVFSGQIKSRM